MKVSKFNKRIGFYEVKRVPDDAGDLVNQEVLVFECWCAVKEQYASDVKSTIGTVLEDTVTFMIRSANPNKPQNKQTLKYKGEAYDIVKITEDPLNNTHTTVYAKKKGR